MQDFDSESLDAGVEHSQKVKATPASRGSGSKDCAFLPASTAVFRLKQSQSSGLLQRLRNSNLYQTSEDKAKLQLAGGRSIARQLPKQRIMELQ